MKTLISTVTPAMDLDELGREEYLKICEKALVQYKGLPFVDTDQEKRGVIVDAWVEEDNSIKIKVECSDEDYDIILRKLDLVNAVMPSFSIRGGKL